jgi:uncharacterized membrane protein
MTAAIITSVVMLLLFVAVIVVFIRVSKKEDDGETKEAKEQRRRDELITKRRFLRGLVLVPTLAVELIAVSFIKVLLSDPFIPHRWLIIIGILIGSGIIFIPIRWLLHIIDKKTKDKILQK